MTTALETTKPGLLVAGTPTSGFDRFIELALNKQVPVETLERLLAMQKDIMAANAKAAFDEAMRMFQKDCPIIQKHKKVMNKDNQGVRYVYAPLDDIIEQVKAPLADHGFSYRLGQEVDKPKPGWLTVSCTATHALGHSETEKFELPLGAAQFMTAQQEVGAARTFGSRYCFLGVFGIMTGDEDTDANPAQEEMTPPAASQPQKAAPAPQAAQAPASKQPAPAATAGGLLTATGGRVIITPLPCKKAKPTDADKFRYKVELLGHEKPFYTFDKKINAYLSKWAASGEATITYVVGKYGQDIKDVSFSDPNASFEKFCEKEATK